MGKQTRRSPNMLRQGGSKDKRISDTLGSPTLAERIASLQQSARSHRRGEGIKGIPLVLPVDSSSQDTSVADVEISGAKEGAMGSALRPESTRGSVDWPETVSWAKWSAGEVENIASRGSGHFSLDGSGSKMTKSAGKVSSARANTADQDDFSVASVNRRLDEILNKLSLLSLPDSATDEERQDIDLIRNMASSTFENAVADGGGGHSRSQEGLTTTVHEYSMQNPASDGAQNDNASSIHWPERNEISGIIRYDDGDAADNAERTRHNCSQCAEAKVAFLPSNGIKEGQLSDILNSQGDAFERKPDGEEWTVTTGHRFAQPDPLMYKAQSYLEPESAETLPRKQIDPSYPYYRQIGTGRLGIAERVDVFQSLQFHKPSALYGSAPLSSAASAASGAGGTPRATNTTGNSRAPSTAGRQDEDREGTYPASMLQRYPTVLTCHEARDPPGSLNLETFPHQVLPLPSKKVLLRPAICPPASGDFAVRPLEVLYPFRQASGFRDQVISSHSQSQASPSEVGDSVRSVPGLSHEPISGLDGRRRERPLLKPKTSLAGEVLRQSRSPLALGASVRSTLQVQEDELSKASYVSSSDKLVRTTSATRNSKVNYVALTDSTSRDRPELKSEMDVPASPAGHHVPQRHVHSLLKPSLGSEMSKWPIITVGPLAYDPLIMESSMMQNNRSQVMPAFTHRRSNDKSSLDIDGSPRAGAFAVQPSEAVQDTGFGRSPPKLTSGDDDTRQVESDRASIGLSPMRTILGSQSAGHSSDDFPSHLSAMGTHGPSRSGLRPPSLVGHSDQNETISMNSSAPFGESLSRDWLSRPGSTSMFANPSTHDAEMSEIYAPAPFSYGDTKSLGATSHRDLGLSNRLSCPLPPAQNNVLGASASRRSLLEDTQLPFPGARALIRRVNVHKGPRASLLAGMPGGETEMYHVETGQWLAARLDEELDCFPPPVSSATPATTCNCKSLSKTAAQTESFAKQPTNSTTMDNHGVLSEVDPWQSQKSLLRKRTEVDNVASYSNSSTVSQGSSRSVNGFYDSVSGVREQRQLDGTPDFFGSFGLAQESDFHGLPPRTGNDVLQRKEESPNVRVSRSLRRDEHLIPIDAGSLSIERTWHEASTSARFSNMAGIGDTSFRFSDRTPRATGWITQSTNADGSLAEVEQLRDTRFIRKHLTALGHTSRESSRECEIGNRTPTTEKVTLSSRTSPPTELESFFSKADVPHDRSSVSSCHDQPRLDTFSQPYELSSFWMNRITPRSQGVDPPNDQPAAGTVTRQRKVNSRTLRDPPNETRRSAGPKKPKKEPEGRGLKHSRGRLMTTMVCSSCSSSTGVVEEVTSFAKSVRTEPHDDDSDLFENIDDDSQSDHTDQPVDKILGPPLDATPTANATLTITRRFRTTTPTHPSKDNAIPSSSNTTTVLATEIGTVTSSMYAVHEGKRSTALNAVNMQSDRVPEVIKADSLEEASKDFTLGVYHVKSSVDEGEGRPPYQETVSEREKSDQVLSYWRSMNDVKTLGSFDSVTFINEAPLGIPKPPAVGTVASVQGRILTATKKEIPLGSFRRGMPTDGASETAAPPPPPMGSTHRKSVKDRLLRIGPLLSPSSDTLDSLTADSGRDSAEQNNDNAKGCGAFACGDGDWLRGLQFRGFW